MNPDTLPERIALCIAVYALGLGGVYGIHRGWIPNPTDLLMPDHTVSPH